MNIGFTANIIFCRNVYNLKLSKWGTEWSFSELLLSIRSTNAVVLLPVEMNLSSKNPNTTSDSSIHPAKCPLDFLAKFDKSAECA